MGQPMIAVTITPEELELLIQHAHALENGVRSWLDRVNQGAATDAAIHEAQACAQALRARAEELAKLRETTGG